MILRVYHQIESLVLLHVAPAPRRQKNCTIQAKCAYKKCKRLVDVKNIRDSLQLPMAGINTDLCRPLREHCTMVKFCSELHRKQCAKKNAPTKRRGGREAMDEKQGATAATTTIWELEILFG